MKISKLSLSIAVGAPVALAAGVACADGGAGAAQAWDWNSMLSFAALVLSGLAAMLGGLSVALHAIAPRTETTIDDRLAADVDAAHEKLDQVLELIGRIAPVAPTPTATAAAAAPSSSSVAKVGTVALLALVLGLGATLPACSSLGTALATGAKAALDCEAQHFGTQTVIDATRLADGELDHLLADAAAPSTDAVKADLAPFASDAQRCVLGALVAAATSAATSGSGAGSSSSSTATATSAIAAHTRIAPAPGPDPAQVRAAFSAAARELGWSPIKVASGEVM